MQNQNGKVTSGHRPQHHQHQFRVPGLLPQQLPSLPPNFPATGQISMQHQYPNVYQQPPLENSILSTGIELQNATVFPNVLANSNLSWSQAEHRSVNSVVSTGIDFQNGSSSLSRPPAMRRMSGDFNTQPNYQCGCNCSGELRLLTSRIEKLEQERDAKKKRWRKEEVMGMIKLRIEMEARFKMAEKKGLGKEREMWEELSCEMGKMGYEKDGSMCRVKWHYINKTEIGRKVWYHCVQQFREGCSQDAERLPAPETAQNQAFLDSVEALESLLNEEEDN